MNQGGHSHHVGFASIIIWMIPYAQGIYPLKKTRGVSHYGLAIYIKKYLKAKEELWKLKYFTMQKYNLQKKSSKRNQNPSRYY
jgi:hypothetical protein